MKFVTYLLTICCLVLMAYPLEGNIVTTQSTGKELLEAFEELYLKNGKSQYENLHDNELMNSLADAEEMNLFQLYNKTSYRFNTLIDALNIGNVRVTTETILKFRYESFSINEAWVNRDIKTER